MEYYSELQFHSCMLICEIWKSFAPQKLQDNIKSLIIGKIIINNFFVEADKIIII